MSVSLALAAQGQAAPPVFWQECENGTAAGECRQPRGITADPSNGHLYASDQENRRIVKFDAWGQFLRAWGWDVVASGPGNKSTAPEPPQLEVCVPAEGDVCKAGVQGTGGAGQFNAAAGLAADSEGNVYAAEAGTPRRVQKFTPEGEFLLSFGGGVNQGGGTPANPGNLCTAEHLENGDICGAGATGTDPGEFSGATSGLRTVIAVGPGDEVYVGDANRIQRFDTGGVYQDEIAVPGEGVQQLAVDGDGFLYASYELSSVFPQANEAKPNIRKLDPGSGNEILVFEIPNPRAIDVAPNGDVYAFNKETGFDANPRIWRFDSSGAKLEDFGEGLSVDSIGLAVNDVACGGGAIAIYHANNSPSFIRAYSPTPDPECVGDPPAVPPQISDTHASAVGTASATLQAKINPRFWADTTYFVQYGTAECIEGGWESACVAEQPAPPGILLTDEVSGTELPTDPVSLSGLTPGTTYHYRFVAQSGGGSASGEELSFRTHRVPTPPAPCANDAFRTGPAAALSDCRAYEMVSPVDKAGGDIVTLLNNPNFPARHDQSASAPGKLTYSASQAFANPQSSPYTSQYIATRIAGEGWANQSISPPREGSLIYPTVGLDTQYKAFSADLSSGWLMSDSEPVLAPGGIAGYGNLYRRDNASGAYEAQCSVEPPSRPAASFFPEVQGFAADGSSTVFRANDKLTPDAVASGIYQLYECTATGQLRLVSVLPGGAPSAVNSSAGTSLQGSGETGPWIGHRINTVRSAVSADGSRIYWSQSSINPGPLYVRVDGTETIQVSAAPARFRGAAADGSKAIYTVGSSPNQELFEFDLASEESTPIAGGLRGVMGVSEEDASHVYFVSNQELAGEAGPESGQPNLYHYEAGEGIRFIAIVSEADARQSVGGSNANPILSPVNVHSIRRSSRVAPDGRHLAFMSSAPLTGYDNTDRISGEANAEVFHYSAESGKLACASCNPSGARSAGQIIGESESGALWATARIPGWENQHHAPRVLADDGKRLYFESFEALIPGDTNGAKDVYQWEALGKGSCAADDPNFVEASGGCLGLISSGRSPDPSDFVDASADGADVFFKTAQSLLPQDPGQLDIYTARENGGLPSPTPPAPPCEGEACQAPAPAPSPASPSSSAFAGPGNPRALRNCTRPARRAQGLAKRARRAARNAARVSSRQRSRALRRQANRLRGQAKRQRAVAQRCRIANRGVQR